MILIYASCPSNGNNYTTSPLSSYDEQGPEGNRGLFNTALSVSESRDRHNAEKSFLASSAPYWSLAIALTKDRNFEPI